MMSDQRSALAIATELAQLLQAQETSNKRKLDENFASFVLDTAFQRFELPKCDSTVLLRMAKRIKPECIPEGVVLTDAFVKKWTETRTELRGAVVTSTEPAPSRSHTDQVAKEAIAAFVPLYLNRNPGVWCKTSRAKETFMLESRVPTGFVQKLFNSVLEKLEADGLIVFKSPKPVQNVHAARWFMLKKDSEALTAEDGGDKFALSNGDPVERTSPC